jgi:cell shape-determining protein MreD
MKYFFYFITIVLCAGAQAAFFSSLSIWNAVPNLLLLLSMFVAAKVDGYEFLFVALVAGFFSDTLTGLPVGSFMLGYVLLAITAHALFHWFITLKFDWKYVPLVAVLSVASLQLWLVLYVLLAARFAVYALPIDFSVALHRLVPLLFVTALASFPMYWLTELLVGLVSRFEMRKKGIGI